MAIERYKKENRDLRPWFPFRSIQSMPTVEELFSGTSWSALWKRMLDDEWEWTPALEITEKEDRYVVTVELPGMDAEDIHISMDDASLTVSGERKAQTEVKRDGLYICERCYGSFSRSIALPPKVDLERVEARYDKGLLEIDLPRGTGPKPRKIAVSGVKVKG